MNTRAARQIEDLSGGHVKRGVASSWRLLRSISFPPLPGVLPLVLGRVRSPFHRGVLVTLLFLIQTVARAASSSASYTILHDALDAGGSRAQSGRYLVDASLVSFGGLSTSTVSTVITRVGFAGQLNDPPTA